MLVPLIVVSFFLVSADAQFRVCVEGFDFSTRGGYANGIYTASSSRWVAGSSEILSVTVGNTPVWEIQYQSSPCIRWNRNTPNPIQDFSSFRSSVVQFATTNDTVGAAAPNATVSERCNSTSVPRFCLRGVRIPHIFGQKINGEWVVTSTTSSPPVYQTTEISSVRPEHRDSYQFTYRSPSTSSILGQAYWRLWFSRARIPFVYADLYKNLKLGLPIKLLGLAGKYLTQNGGYTVTEGSCPPANVTNPNGCEYVVTTYDQALKFLESRYPPNLAFVKKEIDYLKWYYPFYTFADIVKGWTSPWTNITIDVISELNKIQSSTYKTIVAQLADIEVLYDRLYDAHTTYTPPFSLRPVVFLNFITTMHLAIHQNEFALFGKASSPDLKEYERVFGSIRWVNASTQWWKILMIDGMPAVQVLQDFADNVYGLSHDPGTRAHTLLRSGAFSVRRLIPKKSSMNFTVCNPYNCASTTTNYIIKWMAFFKLTCNNALTPSPTPQTTRNPLFTTTRRATTLPPSSATKQCTIVWPQSTETSPQDVEQDPFQLTQNDLKQMRMGIEDFDGKPSSLRDEHDVIIREHHDLDKIVNKSRRALKHERDLLMNPIDWTPETHHHSPIRKQIDLNRKFIDAGFNYTQGTAINTHVDTNNSILVLHVNTFAPDNYTAFRHETDAAIRKYMYNGTKRNNYKLVIDFTNNGGGSICLGYGFINYLVNNIGWPRVMDTVPNDVPQGETYNSVAKTAEIAIQKFEKENECKANPCNRLGQFAPCAWNYSSSDWMTGGPTVTRVPNGGPVRLSKRLSWGTICYFEKARWKTPPGGAGVPILDGNNLLMISDGFCGSMCAITSSWLNVNGYGEYASYNGLWTSGNPPKPKPHIFNSFPGGQVLDDSQIVSQLVSRWPTLLNTSVFAPLVAYNSSLMEGSHRFNNRELYYPSLLSQPNYQNTLPLEFLDDRRLARFRTVYRLNELEQGGSVAQTSAVKRLYMEWLLSSKNPTAGPTPRPSGVSQPGQPTTPGATTTSTLKRSTPSSRTAVPVLRFSVLVVALCILSVV